MTLKTHSEIHAETVQEICTSGIRGIFLVTTGSGTQEIPISQHRADQAMTRIKQNEGSVILVRNLPINPRTPICIKDGKAIHRITHGCIIGKAGEMIGQEYARTITKEGSLSLIRI